MDNNETLLNMLFSLSDLIQAVFAIFSLYGIYAFIRDWMPKTVKLSIGSFTIKRKYFDVQNITNIVSAYYFNGGQVPSDIRKEIIELTCPTITKK